MPTQIFPASNSTTGLPGTEQCQEYRVYVDELHAPGNPRVRFTSGQACNVVPVPATVTGATLVGGCYVEDTPGAGFTIAWATGVNEVDFEASDGATFFVEDDISSPAFADYWWDVGTWAAPFTQSSRTKGAADNPFVRAAITSGQLSNATANQGEVLATGVTAVGLEWQHQTPGQTKADVTVTVDAPATVTTIDDANGIYEVCRNNAGQGNFAHTVTATNDIDATVATATGNFEFVDPTDPEGPGGTNPQPGPGGNGVCEPTAKTGTTADLAGTGDDVDTDQTLRITLGTTAGGPYPTVVAGVAGDNTASQAVTGQAMGLTAGTTYFYRVEIVDPDGITVSASSAECTFETAAVVDPEGPPGSNPNPGPGGNGVCEPTAKTATTATLEGAADGVDTDQTLRIVWGTTAGGPYPNVGGQVAGDNTAGQAVTANLTGLTDGTTYYYRVEIVDPDGTTVSASSTECQFVAEDAAPANVPPVIAGLANQTGTVNTELCDDFTVTDADGTVAAVVAAPAGATVTDQGGGNWRICYTPDAVGDTTFTVTATDDDGATATADVTFIATAAVVPTGQRPLVPSDDCGDGGGGVEDLRDVEGQVFCVTDENGERVATVIREYVYDADGVRDGDPRLVDAATGQPYVVPAGAIVAPCDDSDCLEPQTFCFRSTATADVPGRQYDLTFPLAQGFGVDSLSIDLANTPMNVVWSILDLDASEFVTELQQNIQSQFTGGRAATVTVTPPDQGTIDNSCGGPVDFRIHIECIALDDDPPTLVQLFYNAGRDLIQNPAYNEIGGTLNERCGSGDEPDRGGAWRALRREDDGGTMRCTNTPNRGWESNDQGDGTGASEPRFEVWCNPGVTSAENVVATPRGTPVQEINAFGSGLPSPNSGTTIWQTFTANASGPFNVEAVVGGRNATEQFVIRLSTGDTNDTGIGDLLSDNINAPSVLNQQNPWTRYERVVNLVAGQTYTLSLRGPDSGAAGGLFTDLRAYQDLPDTRANFVNDDDTCMVSKTTTTITSALWQPVCDADGIKSWRRVSDGTELTNEQFWAQVPAPQDCSEARATTEDAVATALYDSYPVCGVVGGVPQTLQRVVVADQSGAIVSQTFIGEDGGPVTPDEWTPGECSSNGVDVEVSTVCIDGVTAWRREQYRASDGALVTTTFIGANGEQLDPQPVDWTPGQCDEDYEFENQPICWTEQINLGGRDIIVNRRGHRREVYDAGVTTVTFHTGTGAAIAEPAGWLLGDCPPNDTEQEILCDVLANGTVVEFIRRYTTTDTGVPVIDNDFDLDGELYAAQGTVGRCRDDYEFEDQPICYPTNTQYNGNTVAVGTSGYRREVRETDGSITVTFHGVDGAAMAEPNGWVLGPCRSNHVNQEVLCDTLANGTSVRFIRRTTLTPNGIEIASNDYDFDGGFYTVAGNVGACVDSAIESEVLCDDVGPFLRSYVIDGTGNVESFLDTDLTGQDYAPQGTVRVCGPNASVDDEATCDLLANGTIVRYWRRTTTDADGTVTVTNVDAAGDPYVLQGTSVSCGPSVFVDDEASCDRLADGSIVEFWRRTTTGVGGVPTVTTVDAAGNDYTIQGTVVPCSDQSPVSITAQIDDLVDGAAWTAVEAGDLTSITMTVLRGTAVVVDSNGTTVTNIPTPMTLSWSAEDRTTLAGPQSITAGPNSRVIVNFTTRV